MMLPGPAQRMARCLFEPAAAQTCLLGPLVGTPAQTVASFAGSRWPQFAGSRILRFNPAVRRRQSTAAAGAASLPRRPAPSRVLRPADMVSGNAAENSGRAMAATVEKCVP